MLFFLPVAPPKRRRVQNWRWYKTRNRDSGCRVRLRPDNAVQRIMHYATRKFAAYNRDGVSETRLYHDPIHKVIHLIIYIDSLIHFVVATAVCICTAKALPLWSVLVQKIHCCHSERLIPAPVKPSILSREAQAGTQTTTGSSLKSSSCTSSGLDDAATG